MSVGSFFVSNEFLESVKSKNILFYISVLLLLVYICVANPSNTPLFFSTFWMKGIIFLLIVLFTFHDHMLGCLFAVAMILTIVYSHLNKSVSSSSSSPIVIDNYTSSTPSPYPPFSSITQEDDSSSAEIVANDEPSGFSEVDNNTYSPVLHS